jgi:hypothetical protein
MPVSRIADDWMGGGVALLCGDGGRRNRFLGGVVVEGV